MSNIIKYVAYGLGGTTLAAGSFFLVASLSGTPLNALKGVGGLFPAEPKAELVDKSALSELEEELERDTRSDQQLFDAAKSPLTAFKMQDPFSATELSRLENHLQLKIAELEKRQRSLDDKEALLDQDAAYIEMQLQKLAELKDKLLNESDEQRALGEEIEANRKALAAREVEVYKHMAQQYVDGEPEVVAQQLMNVYEADEAAKVLKNLQSDRVAEILRAIMAVNPEQHKAYTRAYQLAIAP